MTVTNNGERCKIVTDDKIDLFAKLTEAFSDDQFRRQTMGRSTGDIIHQIRTNTGIIDMPMVYDKKEAENISPSDMVKAKKYRLRWEP